MKSYLSVDFNSGRSDLTDSESLESLAVLLDKFRWLCSLAFGTTQRIAEILEIVHSTSSCHSRRTFLLTNLRIALVNGFEIRFFFVYVAMAKQAVNLQVVTYNNAAHCTIQNNYLFSIDSPNCLIVVYSPYTV